MTINGGLAYAHYGCNPGEWHTVGKAQLNDTPGLCRNVIAYQVVNPCYRFIVGPSFSVVLFIVKEVSIGYALMNFAVADMVKAAVPDRV